MKSCLCLLLRPTLVLLLLILPVATFAQDIEQRKKPMVVVAVASVDDLLADVGYLTRAAGSPELGTLIAFGAADFIQGLDTTKPAGAYLSVNEAGSVTGVVFVPTSDFEVVTSNIEDKIGALEDVGGGVKQLSGPRKVFLKEQEGWIFVSDSAANLDNLPKDPTARLDGLGENYDVAVRLNVQSIPAELRTMAISEIKEGFERSLDADIGDDQRELQEQFGVRALDDIVRFVEEADELTVGWGVDRDEGRTYIDFRVTAVPGTKLASQVEQYSNTESDFAGFLIPDAAATLHFNAPVTKEDIDQTRLILKVARQKALEEIDNDEDLPNGEVRAEAKEIIESLLDVAQVTIESGKLNGGAALVLAPNKINFVAGGAIADGDVIEQNLKKLVELAKKTEDQPDVDVNFNAGQHGDITFHTLTVPLPEGEEEARKILGDKLMMVIGTGKDSLYVAFGDESMELIKQVIDASRDGVEGRVLPMSFHVALTPIMAFAASVDDNPVVAALAESLENGDGKDGLSVTATAIKLGVAYRIEVEEGVLQTIGQATKLQGQLNRDPF